MEALSEDEIRRSFVNCSRGAAQRANLPEDLDALPWPELDFLGWVDPKAPQLAYAVVAHDGELVGIQLRRNSSSSGRTRMCSLCCTVHPSNGVSLMVANKAGKAGRDGNTVGVDVCSSLRCSEYVHGLLAAPVVSLLEETVSLEQRVERLEQNLAAFIRRVRR